MGREERIEQLKSFLTEEPGSSFLRYALAMEYLGEARRSEAKTLLEDVLRDDPDYLATYYHLGKLLSSEGDKERALALFQEGMKRSRERKEQHQLAELQSAYNNLLYGEEDDDE